MIIQQQDLKSNSSFFNNSANIQALTGNVVPHYWYHKILSCGKPDFISITILSELLFLYRKTGGRECNDGYSYFERKFNLTRSQMQMATGRLHEQGLVEKSFRMILAHGRRFPNELHLKLNISVLLALKDGDLPDQFDSGNAVTIEQSDTENSLNEEGEFFAEKVLANNETHSFTNSKEHIMHRKISIKESRSMKSTLSKFDFEEISLADHFPRSQNQQHQQRQQNFGNRIYQKFARGGKTLSWMDFYPLDGLDVSKLQSQSGREFDTNFTNQLLLKMAAKNPNYQFPNKRAFLSYMTKLLKYEIRDAVQVSNGSFKFKGHDEEYKQEQYLASVENDLSILPEHRLRRKIAGIFVTNIAYFLLTNVSFRIQDNKKFVLSYRNSAAKDESNRSLSANQQARLLGEVKSVYGNHIEELVICTHSSFIQAKQFNELDNQKVDRINIAAKAKKQQQIAKVPQDSVWNHIRLKLISVYGQAVDKNWFSKLTPEINQVTKEITLRAPSEFFKDWIEAHYRQFIEKVCLLQNFKLGGICL